MIGNEGGIEYHEEPIEYHDQECYFFYITHHIDFASKSFVFDGYFFVAQVIFLKSQPNKEKFNTKKLQFREKRTYHIYSENGVF